MDPFAVLGLERRFDVDLKVAEKNHRELSRALHPDRYSGAGASEKREALSRAVEVNEAWRIVRDPVRRAEALFALAGIPTGETTEPKPSPAFLMEMMEQREALAEAKAAGDAAAARTLGEAIAARARAAESSLAEAFAGAGLEEPLVGDRATRPTTVHRADARHVGRLGELRFYRRFLEEVDAIEEEATHGRA